MFYYPEYRRPADGISPPNLKTPKVIPVEVEPGKCYENAVRFALANEHYPFRVVHGVLAWTEGHDDQRPYGHAWVEIEHEGTIISHCPTDGTWATNNEYHNRHQVTFAIDYSIDEIRDLARADIARGVIENPAGPFHETVKAARHA